MSNILRVENVSKEIGKEKILKDVNLEFQSGSVYVLTGENGAGKTMLLRFLAGLMSCGEGKLFYNGEECFFRKQRKFTVGLLLENVGMYNEFNLMDNLELLRSVNRSVPKEAVGRAIARVGLDANSRKKFGKFSLGMKKRAMIAQAIMEEPEVLLLDEPTNGLDAAGRKLFYEIVKQEKERGAIVIISSHISDDISEIADCVINVQEGCFTMRNEVEM